MVGRIALGCLVLVASMAWFRGTDAQTRTFNINYTSRATFKTEAPLETIVGTTAGQGAVTGTIALDPARPQDARGTIKVDLNALKTGIDRRDAHMRSKDFFDSEANEAHRFAVFDIKGVETTGPLEPGKVTRAAVRGTLTIRGKPIETLAECTINYVRLTAEQAEAQKRFGFTTENMRVSAKFSTTFTNHGMQVPQLLILKVSNEIVLETDLVLILAQP